MRTMDKDTVSAPQLFRNGLLTASLIGMLFAAAPVTAASACKGLDNTTCSSNAACGWVDGYQRKDGRSVKSFCRTKSVSKRAAKGSLKKATNAGKSLPAVASK